MSEAAKTDEKHEDKRQAADVKLEDLLGGELKLTGSDIPDGSYPAVLFGYGEPFKIKQGEQFRKEGQPEWKTNFELRFGLVDKQKNLVELRYMCGIPEGGAVNRKSNLFKALSSIDPTVVDAKTGLLRAGVKLADFIGKPVSLGVKKNKKEFPNIETIAGPMDGVKYPTLEECKSLLTSSEGVPF